MIYDVGLGASRLATTDDFSAQRPLISVGVIAAITVTNSAQTLSALLTAAGAAAIDSTCNWLELKIRDDQAFLNVVKLAYSGTVTSLLYDASMSLDPSRFDPVSMTGKGSKALFDAYSLIATANTVVLVRQYLEG